MPIIINYSNYYKGIREEAGAGEQDKNLHRRGGQGGPI